MTPDSVFMSSAVEWTENRMHGWLAVCSMACCDVTGNVGGDAHAPERTRCSSQNDDATHAVQRRCCGLGRTGPLRPVG